MEPTVVVVVGGGYAGTMVAKELDSEAAVILIDPRDAFVNVSSSMRALVRREWVDRPFFRYENLLQRGRIVRAAVASVDPTGVTLDGGERIAADYIVLATGSRHSYPARPRELDTSAADASKDLRETNEQLEKSDRVLIVGAGPVGLELAGEIREAWPHKRVTIVDRSREILSGFLPELRADLLRQLTDLDIQLRLGTSLREMPPVASGVRSPFSVATTTGDEFSADIWFRSFGARPNTGYLADGELVELSQGGTVPVGDHLNVLGHERVYAVGDIAELTDAKMATWAQTQAPIVVANIVSQLRGEPAQTVYKPATDARILLPLGSRHGVGQLPGPDGGVAVADLETVIRRKGADLFTARFAERFGQYEGRATR